MKNSMHSTNTNTLLTLIKYGKKISHFKLKMHTKKLKF